jgi:hypothetical protein
MGEGFLDRLAERMSRFASSKTVFGEPIERDGTTIVPVTKFRMRFRARRAAGEGEDGGHGGGIVCSKPLGYLEVRNGKTRFRPVQDADRTALALLGSGALLYLTLKLVLNNGRLSRERLMDRLASLSPQAPPTGGSLPSTEPD